MKCTPNVMLVILRNRIRIYSETSDRERQHDFITSEHLNGSTVVRLIYPKTTSGTWCIMKVAFQLFLLCCLCLYLAIEGTAPAFTAEPLNPSLVVEGNNLTLEWTYNFGSGSFRQLLFGNAKTNDIVDKLDSD
ncbi:uncharacterized protein LOC144637488 isoform X1 [Oculina patagonica]